MIYTQKSKVIFLPNTLILAPKIQTYLKGKKPKKRIDFGAKIQTYLKGKKPEKRIDFGVKNSNLFKR